MIAPDGVHEIEVVVGCRVSATVSAWPVPPVLLLARWTMLVAYEPLIVRLPVFVAV